MHNVLNCHNVSNYCKFDARGTVVPNTATVRSSAVEIKMATFTDAKRTCCVFWFEETHTFKENFALSIVMNLPIGLQFTRGTRILLRPDVLCAMPSHPVAHVFLTLQWNSLDEDDQEGRIHFEQDGTLPH
jgi:hypothetical protein